MPTLPTLTVPQEHYDRIVAAFPGATLAEKAKAYTAWLTNNLIDFVTLAESMKIGQDLEVERARRTDLIKASLPARQTYPPA